MSNLWKRVRIKDPLLNRSHFWWNRNDYEASSSDNTICIPSSCWLKMLLSKWQDQKERFWCQFKMLCDKISVDWYILWYSNFRNVKTLKVMCLYKFSKFLNQKYKHNSLKKWMAFSSIKTSFSQIMTTYTIKWSFTNLT